MPRPSWALIVTSAIFIGGCLFFGGFTCSGFVHWDPCAWVVAVFFGGPSFAISYWQYTATFRANLSSARILRFLLPMMGAGGFLLAGIMTLEPVLGGVTPKSDYLTTLVLPTALLGAWLSWVGLLNFRWHRELIDAPILATLAEDGDTALARRTGFRISLRESLALIAAFSIVIAGATFGYRDIPPKVAMHVTPEEARIVLPGGATDVSVWRNPRGTIAYNFAINEAGFWEWTESIRGTPESQASGVTVMPVSGSFEIYDPFAQHDEHAINRGWYYDFHVEDRGLQYAYDADEGRAHYSFHAF